MQIDFTIPTRKDITAAHTRIRPYIHQTPLLSSFLINKYFNCNLYFKCENFQKAGAFKSRGAVNAVFSLPPGDLEQGVCTHSSGNHAQALARAASLRNTKAFIVMPESANPVKIAAVKEYGGNITFCKPTLQDRERTLKAVQQSTGAVEVHPYNNLQVITGQATCAKESFEQSPAKINTLITPVGGGGLLSGSLLATRYYSPDTQVVAAEPEGADDAYQSLQQNRLIPSVNPNTIADGLLTSLGSYTWPLIRNYVNHIFLASDLYIIKAMRLIWERMKIITEPSGAVPLAMLWQYKEEDPIGYKKLFASKNIIVIISGGNIDLDKLPWNKP